MIKNYGILVLLFLIIALPICIADEPPLGIPIPDRTPIKNTAITTTFFYAGQNLVASKGIDGINYFHSDRLGSTRIITDQNQNIISEIKTLPFGEEIRNTNDARFTFTGKELDKELYYIGARYYNPDLGRFTSVDPVKENHAYSYVSNNPLYYIDPNGMVQLIYRWGQGTGSDPTSWGVYGQVFDPVSGLWSRPELLPAFIMVNGVRVNIITSETPVPYTGTEGTVTVDIPEGMFFSMTVSAKDTNPSTLEPRESVHSVPSDPYPYDPSYKCNKDESYSTRTSLQIWADIVSVEQTITFERPHAHTQNPISGTQVKLFGNYRRRKVEIYDAVGRLINTQYVQGMDPMLSLLTDSGQRLSSGKYFGRVYNGNNEPIPFEFTLIN